MLINLIILCLVVISFSCVYKCENCDIKLKYALYSLCAVIFVLQLQKLMNNNINENFTPAEANEALQNIASLYNTGELTVTKLKVTGDLEVNGKSSFSDDITSAKKLTTTDASIGNQLFFTNKNDTAQKETWYIHNWENRLNMRSTKNGTGGVLLQHNYNNVPDDGIVANFYDNLGGTRMLVGTSSVSPIVSGSGVLAAFAMSQYPSGSHRSIIKKYVGIGTSTDL